ncbi:hypothetical protein [Pseudoalteromonas sp. OOF1S-7]|uniref:hypothetical protein n=1 Tax=Pseudoalteromonas sp. OOF1S-7 TaxID=2917757 RepID=UPI001EF5925D|nr:hypothetical protein [Pseudoalteromonas sp. OOF1S-7]MCG7534197.1 hypothetical protein [Pseudoalteromonas sp. OOF1S-7]
MNKSTLYHSAVTTCLMMLAGCNLLATSAPPAQVNTASSCPLPEVEHPDLAPLPVQSLPEDVIAISGQGGLCNARSYKVTRDFTIWRAWNSTYKGSKFGKWWSLEKPLGPVAHYRAALNICPKYSPLDMLVRCTLKAGSQVVIGPGQSAQCSDYFTYPQSDTNQLYLADAGQVTMNCATFYGEFSWREATSHEATAEKQN